ncbi:MAG TPA: hypothetical protein PKH94_01840 [Bacteroidales bacterium]|nr:hypothetical protein [Bacteroidales bacterium]HNS45960.1 hypothetical protein [Bacteroidales bacterium]
MTDTGNNNGNYGVLIRKLDQFIRKYYKNRIVKGLIYSVALVALFYLVVSLLEFIGHFGTQMRTVLFYGLLAAILIILVRFVAIPVFQLFKIGKIITREQAAGIIGKHFPEVRDKLLNTLQLGRIEEPSSRELIEASISQKIRHLTPIPFHSAIQLRDNRKYLKYALVPLSILLFIFIAAPGVIREPTHRIVNHNVYFERELPFSVWIENKELKALRNEDFKLIVGVSGEQIPEAFYLEMEGQNLKLSRESNGRYSYLFRNIQRNVAFYLTADKYRSDRKEILVIPSPVIGRFEIKMNPPVYTGKKEEVLENTGDLIVPEGTRLIWKFFTTDTDSVLFSVDDRREVLGQQGNNVFVYEHSCYRSSYYSVKTVNRYVQDNDSLFYTLTVIPDLYPTILAEEYRDTLYDNRLYFKGNIRDDYGFTRLLFRYGVKDRPGGDDRVPDSSQRVAVDPRQTQQLFYHFFDITSLSLSPGDEVEYFFEVWDNDAVNGNKSSRTPKMTFRIPSLEEIDEQTQAASESLKNEMESTLLDLKGMQKDIEELHRNFLEKKSLNWQEEQQLEQLLKKQQSIQNRMEDLNLQNLEKSVREQQYKEVDPDILEKQKELEKLFEEILSEDVKKLIEELQQMMSEMDKDKINEMLEKMKWTNEDIEQQLDRSLELFKRFEFEKRLADMIDKIGKLSEKQEKLSEETSEGRNEDAEELMDKQEKIGEEFDQIGEELDELDKMNQELEDPNQMENTEQDEQGIKDDLQNSQNELSTKKFSKASKSQQGAARKMKEMSSKLQNMMDSMMSAALGEDIWALREILENLLQVSFDQEKLMDELSMTGRNDPVYNRIVQDQKKLKDDVGMIEDSLFALSKRQPAIKAVVQREINEIDDKLSKTLADLAEKNVSTAQSNQQYVMTSVNNLALLLSESLQNMQSQMDQMSQNSGGGSCPNPGGSSPSSISTMRQLQEQLNKQIEQLKKGMDKGQGSEQMGMPAMSEQLARLAAQQEALRNQLRQYMDGLKEQGLGDQGEMKRMIEDMEKTETDLVNKMITNQTLMRQQEILSRLLESEKAERMRELEEQRESKEVKNQKISNPEEFFKYKGIKDNQTEILKSIPPGLKPFYKRKVNDYLFNFED